MVVNYNKIGEKFSKSRENMKWEEVSYFIDYLEKNKGHHSHILDIGCGNGRLAGELKETLLQKGTSTYLGIDYSDTLIEKAQELYPSFTFTQGDMRDISAYGKGSFDVIFLIASFHHLETEIDRLKVLENCKSKLNKNGYIFMTNWALDSKLNYDKYLSSRIPKSCNIFNSYDYSIKFGEYYRYYHGFHTTELGYLFQKTGFNIIKNQIFKNERNIISILQK